MKAQHSASTARCTQKGCKCIKYDNKKVKAIVGNEFYLSKLDPKIKAKENRSLAHLCVLAKNFAGWKALIKSTSESNKEENYYYRPRLNLEKLAGFAGDLITFSGHPGSDLANILFDDPGRAYSCRTIDAAKACLKTDCIEQAIALAKTYQNYFGVVNFYIEIQLIDAVNFPAAAVIGEVLREVSRKTRIRPLATADSHYATKADAVDQRILLCTAFGKTLNEVEEKLANDEDVTLAGFFRSNNYHIPSPTEMAAIHTEEELESSLIIADNCEEYSVLAKPKIPKFTCPDGKASAEYLRELCRHGWKKKIIPTDKDIKVYSDRVKHELEILTGAGLADYFLIVQDYVNAAKNRGEICGPGRGSAAGSLVSYLLNITDVDPIQYNLLFERFYNAGRNTKDRQSLADIDVDFQVSKREDTISYIRNKYGAQHVGQMLTFGRMQGRSSLTDVLRAHGVGNHEEWKRITEHIPDEAAISDQLQVIKESGEDASIIRWSLENNSKDLRPWCYIDDNEELQGDYAKYFAQAIRLEGTIRSQGKHAAGLIISDQILAEACPMIYNKGGEPICGFDMHDMEAIGMPKVDCLGVAALDKIAGVLSLLNTGTM